MLKQERREASRGRLTSQLGWHSKSTPDILPLCSKILLKNECCMKGPNQNPLKKMKTDNQQARDLREKDK